MEKETNITGSKVFLATSSLFALLLLYKGVRGPEVDIKELFFISMPCLLFFSFLFCSFIYRAAQKA